jgi:hypothetical protein
LIILDACESTLSAFVVSRDDLLVDLLPNVTQPAQGELVARYRHSMVGRQVSLVVGALS